MKKTGKIFGKTTAAALAAALMMQGSAAAASLDDLNEIMENQMESGSSLLAETLGLEELSAARKENGSETSLTLQMTSVASYLTGLPDALTGELGIRLDTDVDPVSRQWNLDGALTLDGEDIGNLTLYGDAEMLSLEIPQLLSYPLGLRSGSFQEQYEGSVWEELIGDLGLTEDIALNFFPDGDDISESLSFVNDLKQILEDGLVSVENAIEVTTREDGEQPGVTLYDVTYDTESILELYGDALTEVLTAADGISGVEVSGMEDFETEWEDVTAETKEVLGDQFTITYAVENDLVTGMTMSLGLTEEILDEDLDEDGTLSDEQIGEVGIAYIYADPADPGAGAELQIQVQVQEDGEEEENMEIHLALAKVTDETSEVSTLSLTVMEDGETLYDGDIYQGSFDAETGEWNCTLQVEDEDAAYGLILSGVFSNIEKGQSFDVTLDQAAVSYDGTELSLLTGSLSLSAQPGTIDTPQNVSQLADMDENGLMEMLTEVSTNAQTWMEEMGLVETEEAEEIEEIDQTAE